MFVRFLVAYPQLSAMPGDVLPIGEVIGQRLYHEGIAEPVSRHYYFASLEVSQWIAKAQAYARASDCLPEIEGVEFKHAKKATRNKAAKP